MTLLVQLLPLLALVLLLAFGRAGPILSCAVAIVLSLPAALQVLPASALGGFVASSVLQGLWLAIVPVGIVTGGLAFHEAVGDRAGAAGATDIADALFTGAFLLGPFTETVTGFGVGCIFALASFRSIGVRGAPAAAIALLSQVLIPWGGLGPGTAIGAALAGVDPQAMAARAAVQVAGEWLLLLPLFWHWAARAGHAVPGAQRLSQLGWVAAAGALLVGLHHLVPWEVCGLLATGPVLAAKLLLRHRPRGVGEWRAAIGAAAPYLLLALVLLGSRLWTDAPAWAPLAGQPALPANQAMVALWLVAFLLLLRRGQARARIVAALRRARRPAAALLMFVLLARFLTNGGVPQALAGALAHGLGRAAPFAAPMLAGVAGFFAGTNVGSNSAMMPLQAALGQVAGLGRLVLPSVQNGTLFLILSPQLTAIAGGLAGTTPARIWRLGWPVFLISLGAGLAAIAIG
ncbi:MAG: L-lactate permease [Rhodospirillales bacterium]|nr:L-lactate permease [Rhodospirillales bacterium]